MSQARRLGGEIAQAAESTGLSGRVCGPGCSLRCSHCGSSVCQCLCSPACPGAARGLSSCPDAFPIEPAILPLVFQMRRLGLFAPCWSCEGHRQKDGSPWKAPRVWFTCDSVAHLRLLASGVAAMKIAGRLKAHWQVVVVHSDPENPQTTFSLEPEPGDAEKLPLTDLQADVAELARSLQTMVSAEARALLRRSGRVLPDGPYALD